MIRPLELTAIPAGDEALRGEVRAFLDRELRDMPAGRRARSWLGYDAAFSARLAERGWVGLTLPRRLGGGGRSHFARFVLNEELLAAGAPVAAHWIAERQSAPLLLNFGTEAQQARYIPRICRGEAHFCIGMSEPGAGSDLAGVRTSATPSGGGWRLNGSKIWTTNGHLAHFMIALVRTSGKPGDRQKGLSQFIVDLSLPGVTRRPILDLAGDAHFAEVHFDDVELGEDALVGREGEGWAQVMKELAFERSGPERLYSSMVLLDQWLAFVRGRRETTATDRALAGRLIAELGALRQMSLAVTARLDDPESPVTEASIVKDLGTRFEQDVPERIAEHLASLGTPIPADLGAALDYTAAMAPSFSLRGGTREVLRGIIARGLGLR